MKKTEFSIPNSEGRRFAFDLHLPDEPAGPTGYPLLIFAHGFKGFKDWGIWDRLAQGFAEAGFAFLKFDYSMNGMQPGDGGGPYSDLEAFGRNTFSQELRDWQSILAWVEKEGSMQMISNRNIGLIGHSRSGPVALLTAARNSCAGYVITWASVQGLGYAWHNQQELEKWQREGVLFAVNARTGQKMLLYYSLYEDFITNHEQFALPLALKDFAKPVLLIHGTDDEAVPHSASLELKKIIPKAELRLIPGANHVFGGHHPFGEEEELPEQALHLLQVSLGFAGQTVV